MTGFVQKTLFDDEPPEDGFKLLPLDEYDIIAVSYSGGKDSLTLRPLRT